MNTHKNHRDEPLGNIYRFYKDFSKSGLLPNTPLISGSGTTPHVLMGGAEVLMFGSNNYLGLANNDEIIEQAVAALRIHGLGPGGSRILCGNLEVISEFEKKLGAFVGVEDTITFPTGYMANLAVFSALMDSFYGSEHYDKRESVIFSDIYNHATIIDGCRLSSAEKNVYPHNNINALESLVKEYPEKKKLIVTESIFSTEGTLTDIPRYLNLAKQNSSLLMVDDAHGLGVLGSHGGGVVDQFNFSEMKPDIVMASFDKAIGTMGGFLGGTHELVEYLRIASRPYLFSSSIPAVIAAATSATLDYINNHRGLIKKLFANAGLIRSKLRDQGFNVLGNDKTPVVPLFVGEDLKGISFERELLNNKIFAPCFRWPAAPKDQSRIRITPMATHSEEDIQRFINICIKVGRQLKMIE